MNHFKDRSDAGQQLAKKLLSYQNQKNVLILALPRGGVPVAFELAKTLHLPITVFLVRKLGVPGQGEFAMGAIAEENICIIDQELVQQLSITDKQIEHTLQKEQKELDRRLQRYRQEKTLPSLNNKVVILVDDGIATGATSKAAIKALKKLKPQKIVVAVPVASKDSSQEIAKLVDEVFFLAIPEPFYGVGQSYQNFEQTSDEEVLKLLQALHISFETLE